MVAITERAAVKLQDLLSEQDAQPDEGIRLTPDGSGGIGMSIDTAHDGDEVVEDEESPVLIVDRAIVPRLTDMVVDYEAVEDDHRTTGGFVLRQREGSA
jgi:Fe-S cluster assembly iron-binding protein IscA